MSKLWPIGIVIGVLVVFVGPSLYMSMGNIIHIEGFTYPKATRNLEEIKTWTEDEVWSFYLNLKCNGIQYGSEFEKEHPKVTKFCNSVSRIWSKKYKKSKEKDINWDLFNSLTE